MILQNRRGLDLLTAEKGGLCLILEEAYCFYTNKSGIVKEATRNLTNRASKICQQLSNSWQIWLSNWNWIPWVLPFLGPLLLLTLILTLSLCLMCLFSNFLPDHLQAFTNWIIHKLLLTRSNYQKLPHTTPFDPHSSLFWSHPWYPCPTRSRYWRLTFGPFPKSRSMEWYGPHGDSLLRWLIMLTSKTKKIITVILETDQIAQWTFCLLTGAYTFKAMRPTHSRPPAKWPQDSTTG